MNFPECHSRRDLPDRTDRVFCAHPKVHAQDQLVPPEFCKICHYRREEAPALFRRYPPIETRRRTGHCFFLGEHIDWRTCESCRGHVRQKIYGCRHLLHSETSLEQCLGCPDFESTLTAGGISSWAVGMTTAPRESPTLNETLQSLAAAGWDRVHLFAEPGSANPPAYPQQHLTTRCERLGAFPNWFLGLSELVLRYPQVDAYLMCQDDVQFARGLRKYLERVLWPENSIGVVSLYCMRPPQTRTNSGFHPENRGWESRGALAYVFPNAAARALLSHPLFVNHRQDESGVGLYHIDSLVGKWCDQVNLPYLVHYPSLVWHTGATSTIFPGAKNVGLRQAIDFVNDVLKLAPV